MQSITLDPLAFEGDFRLAFLGESTAALAYNATAAQVQAALAALPTVGVGNVVVSGPAGGPWSVQFVGALGSTDVADLTADVSGLIAHVNMPPVLGMAQGVSGSNATQQIAFSQSAASGGFTLTFEGETTPTIAHNATAAALKSAPTSLSSLSAAELLVTGTPGNWLVEFVGPRAGLHSPAPGTITGDAANLAGGYPAAGAVTVVEVDAGADEVQQILFDPIVATNGGTFRVRLIGSGYSAPLDFNASALQLQQALESLETVGVGNVEVAGSAGNWTVKFVRQLASTDVDEIVVDRSLLRRNDPVIVSVDTQAGLVDAQQKITLPYSVSGGTFTLTFKSVFVTPLQEGGGGVNERQSVVLPAGTNGGTFTLAFNNGTTAPIPFNATAAQLAGALGALSTVGGAGNVLVSGGAGSWTVEFQGALADQDVTLLLGDASSLTGSFTTGPIAFNATADEVRLRCRPWSRSGAPAPPMSRWREIRASGVSGSSTNSAASDFNRWWPTARSCPCHAGRIPVWPPTSKAATAIRSWSCARSFRRCGMWSGSWCRAMAATIA